MKRRESLGYSPLMLASITKRMFLLVLILCCGQLQAEIYQWKDKDGVVHFGDRPPVEAETKKVEVKVNTYKSVEVLYSPDWFYKRDKSRPGTKKVVMYSAEWCGVCKRAKRYFADNNIPYQELDIDKSEEARKGFERLNGTGVPIILVGDKRMNGFDQGRFKKIYANAR